MSVSPQAAGNAVISCIDAAHMKYESNPLDWQWVIEIGWRLLTKQDMGRFKEMCKEGLLGPGDYGLFEDWLAIDGSREAYILIKDGLVLEEEIQEMKDEEKFYNDGLYQARVCGFFLAYHQVVAYHWWLLFCLTELEHYCKFKVSLVQVIYLACLFIFFVLMEASVNEAPGLPLTVGLMGELVKNKEVGRKVAAEGFEGPALDPSAKGSNAE